MDTSFSGAAGIYAALAVALVVWACIVVFAWRMASVLRDMRRTLDQRGAPSPNTGPREQDAAPQQE